MAMTFLIPLNKQDKQLYIDICSSCLTDNDDD